MLRAGATLCLRAEPLAGGGWPAGTVPRPTPVADARATAANAGSGTAKTRSRPRTVDVGWESPTETERSVAALVAEGLTNGEAAERLFPSRHTVDFHLRSIFRKLARRAHALGRRVPDWRNLDLPPVDC
ncbi:MAG TPA: helix-turn-helix transcriptional regulator [Acidimicrobiales bacterium]